MIDLRSDTVTKPCINMRKVMFDAPVGDDVTCDDPSINELQSYAANLLGKEAALFTPSGVQANLIAIMTHCQRGDEYIVGQLAHTYRFEGGGAAVLGSVVPQPIEMSADGSLDLAEVERKIKPNDIHFARTRLLCIENTTWGKVLPLSYLAQARQLVDKHGLGLHLDGARLFNAAVAQQVQADEIAQHFDTVSICLSKGLGAPVGSLLVGSQVFIDEAKHWRKMLGGGMRQAGILAAAGLYALKNNVQRLTDDHANAKYLATRLAQINGLELDASQVQTNQVFINLKPGQGARLAAVAKSHGINIYPGDELRLVTHLDISLADIEKVITVFNEFDFT